MSESSNLNEREQFNWTGTERYINQLRVPTWIVVWTKWNKTKKKKQDETKLSIRVIENRFLFLQLCVKTKDLKLPSQPKNKWNGYFKSNKGYKMKCLG